MWKQVVVVWEDGGLHHDPLDRPYVSNSTQDGVRTNFTWPGSEELLRPARSRLQSRGCTRESPLDYFTQPSLAPLAQSMFAAHSLLAAQSQLAEMLPDYSKQVMERLEPKKEGLLARLFREPPTAPQMGAILTVTTQGIRRMNT